MKPAPRERELLVSAACAKEDGNSPASPSLSSGERLRRTLSPNANNAFSTSPRETEPYDPDGGDGISAAADVSFYPLDVRVLAF